MVFTGNTCYAVSRVNKTRKDNKLFNTTIYFRNTYNLHLQNLQYNFNININLLV